MSLKLPAISPGRMITLCSNVQEGLKPGNGDWKHDSGYQIKKQHMLRAVEEHSYLHRLTKKRTG
ncbi:hypothetical protein [Parashewanella spongiae]|uniref:hypothetical protein n=1 Tax=Parashewanella spongiae TaxID=342950 RepID=UPI00105A1B0B|nr:hypothetical protein [Parashewanella spongiae]